MDGHTNRQTDRTPDHKTSPDQLTGKQSNRRTLVQTWLEAATVEWHVVPAAGTPGTALLPAWPLPAALCTNQHK